LSSSHVNRARVSTVTRYGAGLLAASIWLAGCAPGRAPDPEPNVTVTVTTDTIVKVNSSVAGQHGRALAAAVGSILERAVRDSAFPGAVAVVGSRAGITAAVEVGTLDWGMSPPVSSRTIWDAASLTKVVGMTTAIMQLVEQGRVDLDAPAKHYLPRWNAPRAERITVRHLLTHSAGLPSWRALYKEAQSPDAALALVYSTAPDTVPGARYVYSDIGAILLGEVVANVSGLRLNEYLARNVFSPLGMVDTRWLPEAKDRERIAPTERDPWRQRHLRGEVHDENAYALGGVAGHAGLFSTAEDLARFARMYLNGGELDGVRVLRPETIALFTKAQDSTLSHRALGWETPTGSNSGGRHMSKRAFGHTGFTGTSIWIDPGRDLFIILLTNRVNPTRENPRISRVRVAVADTVARVLDPSLPSPAAR
jgi:serine-type D-Ala-D-Ala carboxypeptidase